MAGDWSNANGRVLCPPDEVAERLKVPRSALRRRFYRALDSAGLKRIRFHDLRHTFGTIAV